jgi:hypothetical protein
MDFDAVFSTIASNTLFAGTNTSAGFGRGGNIRYFNANAAPAVNFTGSIVSDGSVNGTNSSDPNCSPGLLVTPNSIGGNLEGLDAGGNPTSSCGFVNAGLGDQTGVDPQLEALAANGGPTRTRALPAGSPAVNAVPAAVCAGTGLTTDQRSFGRPFPLGGNCDAGAYERRDTDGDGFPDGVDNCPTVAGTVGGCPPAPAVAAETPVTKKKCPKGKKLKKGKCKKKKRKKGKK